MPTRCIFFDFDDTLVRTMDFQFESYRQALKTVIDYDLKKEVFDGYAGYNGKDILKFLIKDHYTVECVYNVKYIIHSQRKDKVKPVRNVIKLHELFKDKYMTALITSSRKKNVENALKDLDLNFNYILTSDEYTGPLKPDPGIYLHAMKDLNLTPDECIGFEDSAPGLAALRAAGIFSIDVKNFYSEGL